MVGYLGEEKGKKEEDKGSEDQWEGKGREPMVVASEDDKWPCQ
jgi:hypothetical protein